MKIIKRTIYICDVCNREYQIKEGAFACELKHKEQGLFNIKDLDRNIEDLREP